MIDSDIPTSPLLHRHGIPIYCDKSPSDYRKDPYERYDPMVIRQSRLHLANLVSGTYPMQPVLDFVLSHIADKGPANVCEVGCGVGRLIGEIAQTYPTINCYGIDYSYQMLRQAQRYWLHGESIQITDTDRGHMTVGLPPRQPLGNLHLLMADACDLPFDDASVDVLISSFTIDRLADPLAVVREWCRVLRPSGRMIIATPLNWQSAQGWRDIPDGDALAAVLTGMGLHLLDHQQLLMKEPIDARGNYVVWQTEIVVAVK